MNQTAKAKREAQARGVRYGCHIELDEGEQPDNCVKDYGGDRDCIYAQRHRSREACKFWLPIQLGEDAA